MTRLFVGADALFRLPSHHGMPVRNVDKITVRCTTETVADYWLPGRALRWRLTIHIGTVWPRMISERVH